MQATHETERRLELFKPGACIGLHVQQIMQILVQRVDVQAELGGELLPDRLELRVDLAHKVRSERGEALIDRERGRRAAGPFTRGANGAFAAGATGAFRSGMWLFP